MLTDPLIRQVLGTLSPAGLRAKLTILIFHRVLSEPDPLFPNEVDTSQFDKIISWVSRWFDVLPLHEAARRLAAGTLPSPAASITFDDGYADNVSNALPILRRHGTTATFFIATSYIGGGRMWNDTVSEAIRNTTLPELHLGAIGGETLSISTLAEKRQAIAQLIRLLKYREQNEREALAYVIAEQSGAALPEDLMMDNHGILTLHEAGMGIGAHTVNHPILRLCDESEARRQISESRDYLEQLIGEPVRLFAYPNGRPGTDYTETQARLVKQLGFDAAVSTAPGASTAGDDRFQLRRFTPWDRTRHRFALRLALNLRA